jgi:hypothetical protein
MSIRGVPIKVIYEILPKHFGHSSTSLRKVLHIQILNRSIS